MQYTSIDSTEGDLILALETAKTNGAKSVVFSEDDLVQNANFARVLDTLEELQFKRIKMNVSGLLLSDYSAAAELVKRGVRIFEIRFFGAGPIEHDAICGKDTFKLLAKAIAEVYTAAIDIDVPVILQFVLCFSENLREGVEQLCEMYPSQIRIEASASELEIKEAIKAGMERGIWVEITQQSTDPDVQNHVAT